MQDLDFVSKMQKRLLDELPGTEKRLASISLEDPYLDIGRLDDNASSDTEAAEESGHERIVALKNELKEMIAKIKRALGKIEKKTYGICENCGKDIDKSRLEVLPVAPLCYECEKRKL